MNLVLKSVLILFSIAMLPFALVGFVVCSPVLIVRWCLRRGRRAGDTDGNDRQRAPRAPGWLDRVAERFKTKEQSGKTTLFYLTVIAVGSLVAVFWFNVPLLPVMIAAFMATKAAIGVIRPGGGGGDAG